MKKEPVCFLLNYPRPLGLEPTIYLSQPALPPIETYEDPWYPEIVPCHSFQDALSRILHFNIQLAMNEFRVVK